MKTIAHHVLAAAAVALFAGCASSVKLDPPAPVENRTGTAPGGSTSAANSGTAGRAGTSGAQSTVVPVELAKPVVATNVGRIIYFDFDSFVVKEEFRSVIEGNARLLAPSTSKRVAIEGHTDERGGREYNLALGQKRAEAVAKSLALLGVSDKLVEPVSFGKERPAAQGSDEAAWAKNRRAEIVSR